MANLPSLLTCGWALASVTPPWVAQRVWLIPVVPVSRCCAASLARIVHPADLLDHLERVVVLDREAGGIIAAVFEAFQALEQDGGRLLFADITDDATHRDCFL